MKNLWSLGGLSWRELVKRTWHEVWEDEVFGQAGRLAFYHFLAVFPCLLLLFFVLSHFPAAEARLRTTLAESLQRLLPQQSSALMESMIGQLKQTAHTGMAAWAAGAGAAWAAVNGTWAVISGLNIAYEVKEERPLWKVLAIAIALTVSLAILFLLALTLVVYGSWWLPEAGARIVQWPILAGLLMASFALLYRFGPNLYDRQWRWSTPGAAAALVLWLTAAGLMRLYSEHFHSYAVIYKQLNGAATLLLWFYFTSAAVLIGGEMNSEIEKAARERSGEPQPRAREGS
ncbi:MAG TPA: YihY/virulence factor BrkB family protein [Bryobacteraceae bacterium]|nr:YihY/virulence factor BrkB family protein [Bryobacteraceae bacterium]